MHESVFFYTLLMLCGDSRAAVCVEQCDRLRREGTEEIEIKRKIEMKKPRVAGLLIAVVTYECKG